jgi:hypothetical protein
MIAVNDACNMLGESRSYFYKHSIDKLRHYKAGRSTKIDASSVEELIAERLAANPRNPQAPRRGRPRKPEAQAQQAETAA